MISEEYKNSIPEDINHIINLAKFKSIELSYCSKISMNRFSSNKNHDGLILVCSRRFYPLVKSFNEFNEKLKKKEGNLILILDQIVDPQNFAMIIRSAVYLGVDAIILNSDRTPPTGSTISSISNGASELMDFYIVSNMRLFINDLVHQKWLLITTILNTENLANKSDTIHKFNFTSLIEESSNILLVLGSESQGIRLDFSDIPHFNFTIPPLLNDNMVKHGPFRLIDSLNVAVSAGIIIYEVKNAIKFIKKI